MEEFDMHPRSFTGIGRSVRSGMRTAPVLVLATLAGTAPVSAQMGMDHDDTPSRVIAQASRSNPELGRALEAIRVATEKYRDVEVALADGYMRDPMDMCVTAEMEGNPRQLGEMGIHFFRPDLLGITEVEPRVAGVGTHEDFRQPGVLVYEPQPDGSLELVAVENLIFDAGWSERGADGPPEFMGMQYHRLVNNPLTDVDEAHGFEPHYELHLWLYRENPRGPFTPFNPDVTCAHHQGAHHHPS
jgi:hypothetical protein